MIRYSGRINLRVPPLLSRAIEYAAAKRFMTSSEYIRQALLRSLEADGCRPKATGKPVSEHHSGAH